jgi:hypothetical protein
VLTGVLFRTGGHPRLLRDGEGMVELQAEHHRSGIGICLDKARVKEAQEAGLHSGTRAAIMVLKKAQVGGIQLLPGIQGCTLAAGLLMEREKVGGVQLGLLMEKENVGGVQLLPGMKWALGPK